MTIGIGIQLAIYDVAGHRVMMENMPVADPSDVYVHTDMNGNQRLLVAEPYAEGVTFKPNGHVDMERHLWEPGIA